MTNNFFDEIALKREEIIRSTRELLSELNSYIDSFDINSFYNLASNKKSDKELMAKYYHFISKLLPLLKDTTDQMNSLSLLLVDADTNSDLISLERLIKINTACEEHSSSLRQFMQSSEASIKKDNYIQDELYKAALKFKIATENFLVLLEQ